MANGNRVAPEDKQTQEIKKPYNKPAFRFERVFETQALSCGKVQSVMRSAIVTARLLSKAAGPLVRLRRRRISRRHDRPFTN